ncbi:ribonuclease P, partial [Candidatus Woesearchaeota archaeon]|nr:ribonuclease P [Candidatus Woesearchaeota archaeon]
MTKDFKRKLKEQIIGRINYLFSQAEEQRNNPDLGKRYVLLARKLSSKAKVRIPRELKRKFCKHCNAYFIAGANYRVRTTGK